MLASDYSLSISINSENKLVIDYRDTSPVQSPPLKASQLTADNTFHIVLDTNILIHDLYLLTKLMSRQFPNGAGHPILVIPYIVLEELDRLKNRSGHQICLLARKAIKFIYDQFRAKNVQLKGQSAHDQSHHVIEIKSPDDNVLNCCLQIKQKTPKVVLLSNDMNLRNKAIVNAVLTFSIEEIESTTLEIVF